MCGEREVVSVTKKSRCIPLFAVVVSHSVAAKKFEETFLQHYAERFWFIMEKKITTRRICLLGVFTAITAILGIYATFRIGNQIKIPLKFITVFMTGAIFGPLSGGFVGAAADVLNALLMPVGPIMPQITLVEFFCGVIYGICFYRAKPDRSYYWRCIVCCLLQAGISAFIVSGILTGVGYFSSFRAAVWIRLPAVLVTFVLHMLVLCGGKRLIFNLKKYITKEEL